MLSGGRGRAEEWKKEGEIERKRKIGKGKTGKGRGKSWVKRTNIMGSKKLSTGKRAPAEERFRLGWAMNITRGVCLDC